MIYLIVPYPAVPWRDRLQHRPNFRRHDVRFFPPPSPQSDVVVVVVDDDDVVVVVGADVACAAGLRADVRAAEAASAI